MSYFHALNRDWPTSILLAEDAQNFLAEDGDFLLLEDGD